MTDAGKIKGDIIGDVRDISRIIVSYTCSNFSKYVILHIQLSDKRRYYNIATKSSL